MYQGDLYIGTDKGLQLLDKNSEQKENVLTELPDRTIAFAASGGVNLIQNGSIYLGSDGGGIYVIEDDNVRHLGVEDGLKSEIILRIKKDSKSDIYWIITSNSISYMKDEKIQTLTNFPYSNNFDMYFDDNGGVWILSSNGIYVVNRDNLLTDGDIVFSFYDMRSGLPYITTANSRGYLSPDGLVSFGFIRRQQHQY